ncbi:MAG: polysaccharide biosynthesis tyrosine autokinase [Pseudomonadota bacterium]|nr:polysaccharide biosynthesis tyrosine autokinase [Pseudomonadota bacterium]
MTGQGVPGRFTSLLGGQLIGGKELRRIFGIFWRRKFLVMGIVAVAMIAGIQYASSLPPVYSATAKLVLNTRQTRVVDVENVVSDLRVGYATVNNETQIIQSTQLLSRVVEKLRLDRDPDFNWTLRPRPVEEPGFLARILPGAVAKLLGVAPQMAAPAVIPSGETVDPDLMAMLVQRLRSGMIVDVVFGTVAIDVSFRSTSAAKAALIANAIADQYIVDQMESKFEASRRATSWLNDRLEDLRKQVEEKEAAINEFRVREASVTGQGAELTAQQLTQINSELVTARARRAEAEARFNQISGQVQSRGAAAAAEVLSFPEIVTKRAQIVELRREQADLLTRYAERHPRILKINAEIAESREALVQEVEKVLQSLRTELEVAQAREDTLARQVQQLERRANTQSRASVELRQLEREADASRAVYNSFLSRFKETREQETIQDADARVISPAEPPRLASEPNKRRIVITFSVLGLGIGVFLTLLLESMNSTFRSSEQVEGQLGLVTFGTVPLARSLRKRRMDVLRYAVEKPNSALAESCRTLRAALMLSNVDRPPRVVLVTSSVPAEGKSTSAALLAHTVANTGKKVIIVDCDLRRPSLHKTLQITNDKALVDVLTGEISLQDAIQYAEDAGVYALAAKETAANAVDLLSSQTFSRVVETLSQEFDMVVLDTAPVLAVSDAMVLGRRADAVIYVVKWDDTPREVVASGLDKLRNSGVNVNGIILAQVNPKRQASYGYTYGGSGYYYGRYKGYYKE